MSFARFVYIGVTQLRKPEEEVLLTPLGELMDQWEIYLTNLTNNIAFVLIYLKIIYSFTFKETVLWRIKK